MRQIKDFKFRAWDGEKMHYGVVPWQWDFCISLMWHRCERSTGDGILGCGGKEGDFLVPGIRFKELMQFTGQKYNGKDLYEGDIVEIEYQEWVESPVINPFNEDQSKKTIRCLCSFGMDSSFHLLRYDDGSNGCYAVQFGGSAVKRKEIIGNIYETPHLMISDKNDKLSVATGDAILTDDHKQK